jgi:hypothetical protein
MSGIQSDWKLLTSLGNTGIEIDVFCHENLFTALDTKYNNENDVDDFESLVDIKVSELETEVQFTESVIESEIDSGSNTNVSFATIETSIVLQSGEVVRLLINYKKYMDGDVDGTLVAVAA